MTSLKMWGPYSDYKRLIWSHPEWWTLCLSGVAWLLLLVSTDLGVEGVHAAHNHPTDESTSGAVLPAPLASASLHWTAMVIAMMFPMVIEHVRITAGSSLWRRRHRAVGAFLLGYMGPWLIFGFATLMILLPLQRLELQRSQTVALAFATAFVWQLSWVKRRSLLACHRTRSLAPTGWRADVDCVRYGWMVGSWCLFSCWALMIACVLSGHGFAAMAGATVVGWAERNRPRPNQHFLCAVIAAVGLAYALVPH